MMSSLQSNKLPIFDIYILSEGGVPLFAGCSTSNYCAEHEGQHPLHAGFIHAIQNFGDEVFSSGIRDLKFDAVKLNFKSVNGYTIVFVNPLATKDEFIQQKLDEVADIFLREYKDKVQNNFLSEKHYQQFLDDIVELGLIAKDRIKSTREIFVSNRDKDRVREKKSIFTRFKRKFEQLIWN